MIQKDLGRATLINADCMEVLRETPDKAFDLAIVDPPYFTEANLHYHNGSGVSRTNIRRNNYHKCQKWEVPTQEYYKQLVRVSKDQIIWGVNYYSFSGVPHGRIVWDKKRTGLIKSFSDAEIASCSKIKGVRIFRFRWDGMLQEDMKNKEKKIHITQKPVALYKWLLSNYANPGDKILDTHLGSGSICIACDDLGFRMTGIELDPDYYEAACKRLINHRLQQRLF